MESEFFNQGLCGMWVTVEAGAIQLTQIGEGTLLPESRKSLDEQRKSRFKVAAYNAYGLAF